MPHLGIPYALLTRISLRNCISYGKMEIAMRACMQFPNYKESKSQSDWDCVLSFPYACAIPMRLSPRRNGISHNGGTDLEILR
ncbi:hypothetical protein [Caudoviricetes sp.]|nr:hypothetical protein [Caudoviricetes sp.]UOF82755.1 hypothetical protein [Caudoviricetes sp.]